MRIRLALIGIGILLCYLFLSAKKGLPDNFIFPFVDALGPFGEGVKAIVEEVFGAAVGALVIFGLFEKRTMKKIEQELRNPHTFVNKLDPRELRSALAVRLNSVRGIPRLAAETVLETIDDKILSDNEYISNYRVRFTIGTLRKDGYREILVSAEYNPVLLRDPKTGSVALDRPLRFRCYLPKEHEIRTAIFEHGYDWSWAFLGHATGCETLPENAFLVDRVLLVRGDTTSTIPVRQIRADPNWIEFVTERLAGAKDGDRLKISLRVLQSNDYGFVSDIVRECVHGYTAECNYHSASDIPAVFPASSLLSSEGVSFSHEERGSASATTSGWVVHGGIVFSWNSHPPSAACRESAA